MSFADENPITCETLPLVAEFGGAGGGSIQSDVQSPSRPFDLHFPHLIDINKTKEEGLLYETDPLS